MGPFAAFVLQSRSALWATALGAAPAALGCTPDRAASLRAGLESGDCDMLPEDLADACRLEARDCGAIVEPTLRDECGFLRAESSGDYGDCASAGRYVEECRMHLWSADIARWEPAGVAPGDLETEVAARAALAGFAADDPRPWSAWYRQVLGRMVPLDRAQCEAVTAALPREACLHTALLVYDDRLNVARDKRLYPCDGGELPPLLRHAPDTAIQARIAARTDLCP